MARRSSLSASGISREEAIRLIDRIADSDIVSEDIVSSLIELKIALCDVGFSPCRGESIDCDGCPRIADYL